MHLIRKHAACLSLLTALPIAVAALEWPSEQETLQPTPGWAPEFRREVSPQPLTRVPLRVDWGKNRHAGSPVTFGMPFARHALESVEQARLVDAEGNPVPAEWRTTATWDGPDGPVRWARVEAVLERDRDYLVEFGAGVQSAPVAGIAVRETETEITVDTGVMEVRIRRDCPALFSSVRLRDADGRLDRALVRPEDSTVERPQVVDGNGKRYVAGGVINGLKVAVVESGPGRTAIRREGWYVDEAGNRFCQFVTYTYFYAGRSEVRHDHTLVVAFDTNEHTLRDIMLPVPLALDAGGDALFASDDSPDGAPLRRAADAGPWRLLQHRHDAWSLFGVGEAVEADGERAGGWFGLADAQRGALAGLSHFWQQYPAELESDGRVLRLHLWPQRGTDPLDFRPSTVLGDQYPGNYAFSGDKYRAGLDEMTQAFGLGKTHQIQFDFFKVSDREAAWARIRAAVVEPVLALPDPAYSCGTEVMFGRVHPYDPEQFPKIEALIDGVVARFLNHREERAQYGWIDFGDVYYAGGRLWRRWASMFYGFPNVMPRLYLRSGRRDAWDFHRVNTRHITDIDICHLDSDAFIGDEPLRGEGLRKVKGRRYGGDGGICHYAGGLYEVGPDHHLAFMLYDYYLNGNLRTREVAQYYIDAHAAERTTGSMVFFGRNPRIPNMGRGTGGALRLFSEAFQATWNPEYLSLMRQLADLIITTKQQIYQTEARRVFTSYNDVYMNKAKILYYQLTGDERMREHFLHDMRVLAERRNEHALARGVGTTMSGPAHAFWFTGDRNYLPFMRWQLEEALRRGPAWMHDSFHAIAANHGLQLPEVMSVLAAVETLPPPKAPPVPQAVAQPFAIEGNWAMRLLPETAGAFNLTLEVDLDRERAGGTYATRDEWYNQLDAAERPALLVLDDAEREVARHELTTENTRSAIELNVPAVNSPGGFTLTPSSLVAPLGMRLTGGAVVGHMLQVGDSWFRPRRGSGVFFRVPAGTSDFELRLKTARVRGRTSYAVRDGAGQIVAEGHWEAASTPRNLWETLSLHADRPEADTVWSISFNRAVETYLQFDGIPSYVASTPEALFDPGNVPVHPMPPLPVPPGNAPLVYAETDLPWPGQAVYLREELTLTASPETTLFNPGEGTLEFWVKTVDPHHALFDRNLVSADGLSIRRRYNIGAYFSLAGNTVQRFFGLPNNRWTHLALTWRPSTAEGFDLDVQLFADGVEIRPPQPGPQGGPHYRVQGDWPREAVQLSGGVWFSCLRISDVARYPRGEPSRENALQSDAHTRLLCRLDGDHTVWIDGVGHPLKD